MDPTSMSAEDKKRKRNSIQMEMLIKESDVKKFIGRKNLLDAEIRKLRMDAERLRIDLDGKQKEYKRMEQEIQQNEDELRHLKKQLNLLV
jgi:chromosome segregation ATPase